MDDAAGFFIDAFVVWVGDIWSSLSAEQYQLRHSSKGLPSLHPGSF